MHVLRPLCVILAVAGLILIARTLVVPRDFGIHERGYMYGWYRMGNVEEWKAVKVKYQGKEYCKDCHADQEQQVLSSPHKIIECENCHGPVLDHPAEPIKLTVDRKRDLCLRCHTLLRYPTSQRSKIIGIDPDQHNPGLECAGCHNPHKASVPR